MDVCLSLRVRVRSQLHMYKIREQFHHVFSAQREQCMLSWPLEMQNSIPSQSLARLLVFVCKH